MSRNLQYSVLYVVTYLCITGTSCRSHAPFAKTLEDEVRETLDFSKFDKSKLDDRLAVLVASTSGRHFYTREDIDAFIAHTRENKEIYEASNFKVLNKNESDNSRFASITYEVVWKISLDNKTRTTPVISHETWERQIDGWHRIFAAMDSSAR